jgi:hypothetical protein
VTRVLKKPHQALSSACFSTMQHGYTCSFIHQKNLSLFIHILVVLELSSVWLGLKQIRHYNLPRQEHVTNHWHRLGAAKSAISFLFNYYSQNVKPCGRTAWFCRRAPLSGLERVTILRLVFELESRGP